MSDGRRLLITGVGLVVIVLVLALGRSSPPQHLPARDIAPEVCQGHGLVHYYMKIGSLLYVHCTDGMVLLLDR